MCLGRRSPTLSGDSTPDRVGLRCRGCGTDYPPSLQYACPNCLGPLDVTYDPATLRARLDRATIEAAARSRAFGLTTLACASTGNLAGATAAAAAAQGMDCVVVIPADLEPAKIA